MNGMGMPQMGGGMGAGMMGGGIPQGPDMSMVSQILAQMRGQQRPQQQGGMNLMSLLPQIYAMLQGSGGMNAQAQMMGQQGLGLANQSPLSLLNPNY